MCMIMTPGSTHSRWRENRNPVKKGDGDSGRRHPPVK